MQSFLDIAFLLTGLGLGYVKGRRTPYRHKHKHAWEVVDKTLVQGTSLDEAIKVAKISDYDQSMAEIMEYVQPEGMLVHYRCPCGEEKVVRV